MIVTNKFGGFFMGVMMLIILLSVEVFFLIWNILSKSNHYQEKSVVHIATFILLIILLATGVLYGGFRYYAVFLVLFIQSVVGIYTLVRKKEMPYRIRKSILDMIINGLIYTSALFLAILCPQYKQPNNTGSYKVATAKYTWVDKSRVEEFSDTGENRALTIEFWYPENGTDKYPLVVFSHGAFGFSGSNVSTFENLASNGYVVASIGHTYHAFFTMDTNENLTIVNTDFINNVIECNNTDNPEKEFFDTRQWMKLRVDDENFVIDTILEKANSSSSDELFAFIDSNNIGLLGHSLGGASSAQLGRVRNDIDAVINLDGTMLGEEIAFQKGETVLNSEPYPVPLLNIYAEDHYKRAMKVASEAYVNFYASRNAIEAYEIRIRNSGHLNFTDLSLFSPPLAKMLGVGTINKKDCIETMNEIVLVFFNYTLKDGTQPQFEEEY